MSCRRTKFTCSLIFLQVLLVPLMARAVDGNSLLQLPVFVSSHHRRMALTEALSDVGVTAQHGYVLFGVEVRLKGGKEPTVRLGSLGKTTLGEALAQIIGQLPGYRFEVVGPHLVHIAPVGFEEDPFNPMNVRVKSFDVTNEPPGNILSHPSEFIAELQPRFASSSEAAFGVGLRSTGPGVTLHLRDAAVREILNAVSEASAETLPASYGPLGWVYSANRGAKTAGAAHMWRFHFSVPSNWKAASRELKPGDKPQDRMHP